jgi:hypothetical protein
VTIENNLPAPAEPGMSVGGITLTPPSITPGLVTSTGGFVSKTKKVVDQPKLDKLRLALRKASEKIDTSEPGTAAYDAAVKEHRRLKTEIENLEFEQPSVKQFQTASEVRKELQRARDKDRPQEEIDILEQKLAEAEKNAVAAIRPGEGLRPASAASGANSGYLPNKDKTDVIFNPATGTISVVDKITGSPAKITRNNIDIPLNNVYIVVNEKKFYERGIESSVRDVTYVTENELIQSVYGLDKNTRRLLQEDMKRVGLLAKDFKATGDFDISGNFVSAFLSAHQAANQINFNNLKNNLPIKGVLQAYQDFQTEQDAAAQPTVTRSVSIPNKENAAKELNNLYMSSVGRKATDKEIDEFYKKVRSTAKSRPTVTTAMQGQPGSGEATAYTTEQGFTTDVLQSMARETAEARPEFAPYQMATTFYDSLLRAAQSPVRLQDTGL